MWHRVAFALLLTLSLARPVTAETTAFGERTQETVPVGGGKFLIFVGATDGSRIGYTVDMIQIQDGIPFYVPLFIEDYDADTNRAKLSYGVAFYANTYLYDRNTNIMEIKTIDAGSGKKYDLRYRLDGDIFHLLQVAASNGKGVPKIIFKATTATPTAAGAP